MRTIEITAVVGPDRKLVVQLPPDVSPGEHHLVVVIDETKASGWAQSIMANWPTHPAGLVPPDLSLRREVMYGDAGR